MFKFFTKIFSSSSESSWVDVGIDKVSPPAMPILNRNERALEMGNSALAAGDLNLAETNFRHAIAVAPVRIEGYINLGYVLTQVKQFDEAGRMLQQAVVLDPTSVDALYMLATIARQQGKTEEAIEYFELTLAADPGFQNAYSELGQLLFQCAKLDRAQAVLLKGIAHFPAIPDFHSFLANIQVWAGQSDAAIDSLNSAISLQPHAIEFYSALAQLLLQQNRQTEALACYQRISDIKPDEIEAFVAQGNLLFGMERYEESLRCFDRALVVAPDHINALMGRGAVLLGFQRNVEARINCEHVLRLMPASPEAHLNLGAVFQSLHCYHEALNCCDKALTIRPGYIDALINRCTALSGLNRHAEALVSCDLALALVPENLDALISQSTVLQRLNRHDEAIVCCNRVLLLRPGYPEAFLNRGHALMGLNQFAAALLDFSEVIRQQPLHADARFNESLVRLLTGDVERGWALYESRWETAQLAAEQRHFVPPLWLGKHSLNGRTILVHAEQGSGDTIQFCRYASILAAQGASVILEVQDGLKPLLSRLSGVSQVLTRGEPLPPFDYHCPLMSLPLAFGTALTTIPAPSIYLNIDEQLVETWRKRLGPKVRPRIGVVWSGSHMHKNDGNRSISLSIICRLLSKEVEFICLQKEVRPEDKEILDGHQELGHFENELRDFSDTAALIANIDLVISVDTSIAHLAGALGKPIWVLLPFSPDWRWLLERRDSPWYPSATLFRQPRIDDWDTVIDDLDNEMRRWICNKNDADANVETVMKRL